MKLLGLIPNDICIAFSGGIDSVAVTHFLMQSKRKISLLYMNHDTEHGNEAEEFVFKFAEEHDLPLISYHICNYPSKPEDSSLEEWWRNCRYNFFDSISNEIPVITCHHLDDQVETWLFSSLHNYPKLIPYRRNNIIRPFLLTKKSEIHAYAAKHKLTWIQDESNSDVDYPRNRIRHNIIPEALKVNPGLYKVIARKVQEDYNVKENKESSERNETTKESVGESRTTK